MRTNPSRDPVSSRWRYWKMPVWFGIGFCVLQVLVALVRFGSMDSWSPAELLFVIPAILSGLVLFFVGGLLVGLFAQRMVRGCHGAWRTFLLVMIVIATPFAISFSLVGGLLGPLFVVLYALIPYLLLVGIPMLIRKSWKRFQRPHRQGE